MAVVVLLLLASLVVAQQNGDDTEQASRTTLDDTGGFIHLAPGLVNTTNGCTEFLVSVAATFTDARVFGLRFFFDQTNLQLISITPGSDTTLHLMPEFLQSDTLWLDGFFHPNFAAGTVTLATLRVRAVSLADATTLIGFLFGEGWGGTAENPEAIIIAGDTTHVFIEGTPPLVPQQLVIERLPDPAYDDSVRLMWRPVHFDADGDPVVNPLYNVYREDQKNAPYVYDLIGATYDTFFYSDYVKYTFDPDSVAPLDSIIVNLATFKVHACKTQP